MVEKMTRYANGAAAQMYIDGKTTSAAGILSHAFGKFFRDYVINFGFLDGARGVISVGMHVYYTFWKYAKLWEMNQLKRMGNRSRCPNSMNLRNDGSCRGRKSSSYFFFFSVAWSASTTVAGTLRLRLSISRKAMP